MTVRPGFSSLGRIHYVSTRKGADMANAGHRVLVRMTATLDDGTQLDLGLENQGEAEYTLG